MGSLTPTSRGSFYDDDRSTTVIWSHALKATPAFFLICVEVVE